MKLRTFALALAFGALAVTPAFVQEAREKGGMDEFGPYEVVESWPKPLASHNAEWGYGTVAGVFAESPDRVFVITRGDQPRKGATNQANAKKQNLVLVFNRAGDLIENWSQWNEMLRQPHSIYQNPYDPERRVWVIDNYLQQILVFSNDGKKLLMKMGEAEKAGTDQTHFGRQADMVWLPDGSFYVADGYDNTRIIKFNKDGKYVMEWGTKGAGPGQFTLAHGVTVDAQGRVLVADRRNSRIQVFDANGKFLDQWPGIRSPTKVMAVADGSIWVADSASNKILKYDRNGYLQYSWGVSGEYPGAMQTPHQLSVDQEGNLYVADYQNRRVQKFVPKKNADKAKVMPRMLGFK